MYSPYTDIPDFEVNMQTKMDMINGKIEAIMSRRKPRDLFDLYFLVTRFDLRFECDARILEKKINEMRELWRSLEPLVMRKLPDFNEAKESILSRCAT